MNMEYTVHHGGLGDTARNAKRRERSTVRAMGELPDLRFEFRRVAVPAVVQKRFPE